MKKFNFIHVRFEKDIRHEWRCQIIKYKNVEFRRASKL